jgi:hypothetical protein
MQPKPNIDSSQNRCKNEPSDNKQFIPNKSSCNSSAKSIQCNIESTTNENPNKFFYSIDYPTHKPTAKCNKSNDVAISTTAFSSTKNLPTATTTTNLLKQTTTKTTPRTNYFKAIGPTSLQEV